MAGLKSTNEFGDATQASLVEFLRTDLTLCSTFADLAQTGLSAHRQHALETLSRAERGCETIEHFAKRVQDATERQEIEQKLDLLRSRVNTIKSELAAGEP